ncbi:MerR family transcriptional regulator [Actinokineospora soli]
MTGDPRRAPSAVGRLDDPDYAAYTIGQAADLLGVQHAFLRSLDAAGVLAPLRSAGGHRRYSRRQLETARRLRDELDLGHGLDAAVTIVDLRDRLTAADAEIDALREHLHRAPGPDGAPRG